ncbi:hypothetical protein AB0L88_33705 [Saccharopolyspora shandongensis]|uniref:hypothetical protein n=1 Tax=Saccharopolyspora shandongensis TaxID=418495 RepID=UPI0034472C08
MNFLAHGLGGRADLPLNGVAAIISGGLAVAISFAGLTKLWSRPWLNPDAGRPLPFLHFVDSPGIRWAARILTIAPAALVVAVAFLGPPETERNLAPWALYVTFWVVLVPISALFGPVWRIVNPLRTLHSCTFHCGFPRRATERSTVSDRRVLPQFQWKLLVRFPLKLRQPEDGVRDVEWW